MLGMIQVQIMYQQRYHGIICSITSHVWSVTHTNINTLYNRYQRNAIRIYNYSMLYQINTRRTYEIAVLSTAVVLVMMVVCMYGAIVVTIVMQYTNTYSVT
jgi:hypothetical protein